MRRFRPMRLVRERKTRAPASLDGYLSNKNAMAPALTSASNTQPRITTQRYAISARHLAALARCVLNCNPCDMKSWISSKSAYTQCRSITASYIYKFDSVMHMDPKILGTCCKFAISVIDASAKVRRPLPTSLLICRSSSHTCIFSLEGGSCFRDLPSSERAQNCSYQIRAISLAFLHCPAMLLPTLAVGEANELHSLRCEVPMTKR
jgi:hypothetical protein